MLRLAAHAMRTRFEIALADTHRSEAQLRAAGEAALAEIAEIEDLLSAYRPASDLYRINAGAGAAPVRVELRTIALLEQVRQLSHDTGGRFDPTVGPLLVLWNDAETVPSQASMDAARSLVDVHTGLVLDQDTGTAFLSRAGMRLDPGAWGKGYALDVAAELLVEMGIGNALLHGGTSTVVALGDAPGSERGWPIAIQHPRQPDRHLSTVRLHNETLSVSAMHGKTFHARDPETGATHSFGHIVDPRSGLPVEGALLAAVVARSGLVSDALSTALLVGGAGSLPDLASRYAGVSLLVAEESSMNPADDLHITQVGSVWQENQR